jgi:hypothetical protein
MEFDQHSKRSPEVLKEQDETESHLAVTKISTRCYSQTPATG